MATSQNGWQVFETYGAPLVSNVIPGTDGVKFLGGLDPRVDVVMRYLGYRWHTEMEPILPPADKTGQWGYNYRAIRGQESGFSNHASGTAVDINSAAHPIGTRTLTSGQLGVLRQIDSDLQGVLRFGAFYSGRVDEMHAEVNVGVAEVARVTALIQAGKLPNVPKELLTVQPDPLPIPGPNPTPEPEEDDYMAIKYRWVLFTNKGTTYVHDPINWTYKALKDNAQRAAYIKSWDAQGLLSKDIGEQPDRTVFGRAV